MASNYEIESLVLRRHAGKFSQCPDCTPILGVLRANYVIDELGYQRIKAKETPMEKNEECLDSIIPRVKHMPEYFKAFCCILNTRSCYESIVKSLVNCYGVYKNEDKIKECIDIEKILSNFKELSAKITRLSATIKSRKECFIIILKENLDIIDKFIEYLASHSLKLYHHIQQSHDEILHISLTKILLGLKKYQDYLKKSYKVEVDDGVEVKADDTLNNNIDINHFVNLSLIKPEDEAKNSKYFEALKDPYHLLFNHEEHTNTNTIPIKSLAEIFDTSGSATQKILIHGSPGSGKTTLANKICIEWAKGNLIQHYTLVILLNLRDIKIRDIESIDEMVECTMGDEFASEVVHDITCIEGKNILLLLEGWDELKLQEGKHLNTSFFAYMIAGKVLKKASVLITSRPSSIGSIEKKYITHNIAILGFSEHQIDQYVDQCFVDSSHGPKNTLKYSFMAQLNTNPVLKSLAYVPVNLKILVYVFKKCESKLPDTLTELYQQYVLLKLRLYDQRKSLTGEYHEFTFNQLPKYISTIFKILCKVAYDGIENQKLYVNDDTVTKELDKDGMGLLQVSNYMLLQGSDKTYDFIHKTVQEFLAAEHLKKAIPAPDQKQLFLENKLNENFVQVLFFYAGLTGLKLFDPRDLFPTPSIKPKSTVVDTILPRLGNVMTKYDELKFVAKVDTISTEDNNNKELCVLISCIAEAKNLAACKAFSTCKIFYKDLCVINIPNSAVTSQLLVSLSYCIAHSGRSWAVMCKNKILGESDILSMQKYLIDTNSTSGKLRHLNVLSNRKEIKFLTSFLQPQFALGELDLCNSNFDDDCISILCSALKSNQTLEGLDLKCCEISSKGIRIIAEMLQDNNVLRAINLKYNRFSDDDFIQALVIMKTNTTLLLMVVDDDYFKDEKVKKQLQIFNKKRKKKLVLNKFQMFRFSGFVSKFF